MQLFLASYFMAVARLFAEFCPCDGKKVAFIPTASNVEKVKFYVGADRKALQKLGLQVDTLDLSNAEPAEMTRKIGDCDIVFVEGGNTFFLLQEMRRTGADKLILEHIRQDKVYIGASAGSIITAPNIEYARLMDDPALGPGLNGDYTGLGVVNISIVPHHTNFPFVGAVEKILKEYTGRLDLVPISNKQVVVVDGEITKIIGG